MKKQVPAKVVLLVVSVVSVISCCPRGQVSADEAYATFLQMGLDCAASGGVPMGGTVTPRGAADGCMIVYPPNCDERGIFSPTVPQPIFFPN